MIGIVRRIIQSMVMVVVIVSALSEIGLAQEAPSGLRVTNTELTTSLSQYGISWAFEKSVEYGTYVNGDYWVLGPVTITSISPSYDGQNGTMINPRTDAGQGYDSTTNGFNSSLVVEAPVTVNPTSSVVTAISEPSGSRPALQDAAVLTVVETVPYADQFRPPLAGNARDGVWRWSDVEANMTLLPNVATTPSTPSDINTYYLQYSQRPWILHGYDWTGRYLHPTNNMPDDYHREIGRFLTQVAVLLLMDIPDKSKLLANFIQIGIDYYGMATDGDGDSSHWQWPTIFAGVMLGDEAMADMYVNGERGARSQYMLYHVATEQRSSVSSSIVPSGKTWTGKDVAWRQSTYNSNCYEQEHLHPTEWSSVSSAEGCSQSLGTRETYRRINSPGFVGLGIAAAAMNQRARFSNEALYFPYVSRWMEEDLSDPSHDVYGGESYTNDAQEYGSAMSDFVDEFYAQYGLSIIE